MNNRAFTLVETLAVIILLGVIMSIAIPSINNAMDSANKRRIKEDAEMFIILAKEYVETHKDFNGGEIIICNKDVTSNCIDGDKLSDTYNTKESKVTVKKCKYNENDICYSVHLENNKYIATDEEGSINVSKK